MLSEECEWPGERVPGGYLRRGGEPYVRGCKLSYRNQTVVWNRSFHGCTLALIVHAWRR
jgi:hypothetical protein